MSGSADAGTRWEFRLFPALLQLGAGRCTRTCMVLGRRAEAAVVPAREPVGHLYRRQRRQAAAETAHARTEVGSAAVRSDGEQPFRDVQGLRAGHEARTVLRRGWLRVRPSILWACGSVCPSG